MGFDMPFCGSCMKTGSTNIVAKAGNHLFKKHPEDEETAGDPEKALSDLKHQFNRIAAYHAEVFMMILKGPIIFLRCLRVIQTMTLAHLKPKQSSTVCTAESWLLDIKRLVYPADRMIDGPMFIQLTLNARHV
jgi:hypothetical protein